LGAPTGYVQARIRTQFMHSLGDMDRLIFRLDLGATSTSNITALTASQRFFAGGDNSVRGYRYNTLGPEDAAGNVIGGRFLAAASVEWEHWFTHQWGMAVFADDGGAFNRMGDGLSTGAGAGLRWQLPFAVFSLDFAHPF